MATTVPASGTLTTDLELFNGANDHNTTTWLAVEGMTCASCSANVTRTLSQAPGVISAEVDLLGAKAKVIHQNTLVDAATLALLVSSKGYASKVISTTKANLSADEEGLPDTQAPATTTSIYAGWRVAISMVLALPVVIHGMWHGQTLVSVPLAWLMAIAVMLVNWPMLSIGAVRLWKRSPGMESLVMLSVLAAFTISTHRILTIRFASMPHLFLEDMAVVLAFVGFGKWLESRAKAGAHDAIKDLLSGQPKEVLVQWSDGSWLTMPVASVKPGMRLRILPWAMVPVDAVVVSGNSHVQQQLLTGEPLPKPVTIGNKLMAGAVNQEGVLELEASANVQRSALQQLARGVQQARMSRMASQDLTDKLAYYFVPAVLLIALVAGIVWAVLDSPTVGLLTFMTVLVVSCPCSLGLAVPIVVVRAMSLAAKQGILLRAVNALEVLARPAHWFFDKTGTLTKGKPMVADAWLKFEDDQLPAPLAQWKHRLLTVSMNSTHPLAEALAHHLNKHQQTDLGEDCPLPNLDLPAEWKVLTIPGKGVSLVYEGGTLHMGSPEWISSQGALVSPKLQGFSNEQRQLGRSLIWVMDQQQLVAAFALADEVKKESAATLSTLARANNKLHILSGDHQQAVSGLIASMKLDGLIRGHGNLLPADKERLITDANVAGHTTIMVGDGANDAAAMSLATTSIAMGAGTQLAQQSAEVVLLNGNLTKLPELQHFSELVMRMIKQNLFWAFAYNLAMIPVAAGVLVPLGIRLEPMWAGVAMAASSVIVVANALRLRWPR